MGVFRKIIGLFVERVPVDADGQRVAPGPNPGSAPGGAADGAGSMAPSAGAEPVAGQYGAQPGMGAPAYVMPGTVAMQPGQPMVAGTQPVGGDAVAVPAQGLPPISVALRAWVPEEYASHLAPFGVHVIAAGGNVTSEQARGWGADVLVVSAECLGQDLHLLQQPHLATVFITPQPAMIADQPGLVQVQEPLRASDVADAARRAAAGWQAAHPRAR